MNSTQASATIFGFQFQINAAIYLMLKHFSDFDQIKVEGSQEDIELCLHDNKKIYAQAKSKEFPTKDNKGHSEKLKDALRTLSNVDDKGNYDLMYISNLEENPLNSGTKEFDGISFLKYDELKEESKKKIDNQISNENYNIDTSRLIIAKIPFYGDDWEQRHKEISKKMSEFVSDVSPSLSSFANRIITIWEEEFLHNASVKSPKITINKENVVWGLVVCKLQLDDVKKFDEKLEIEETDFLEAIDEYEKIIDIKSSTFLDYNKIISLYSQYKLKSDKSVSIYEFIQDNKDEIFNLIFPDKNKADIVLQACSKIIAKEIILRSKSIEEIKRGVENYGNK